MFYVVKLVFTPLEDFPVTAPSVFWDKITTVAPNANEHIYAELTDIRTMLWIIMEKLVNEPIGNSNLTNLEEACALLKMSKSSV